MMESTAWNALDLRQRGLYLQLKAKYTQKVLNGNIISDNAKNISIPTRNWKSTLRKWASAISSATKASEK